MNEIDFILYPLAWCLHACQRIVRRMRERLMLSLFASHGRGVRVHPGGYYTYGNIRLGNNVIIGEGAILMASESKILLGDNVMIAPQVTMIGGNHNTSVLGRPMRAVDEKLPSDDQDITVEEDVWIGARATILKGVVIRRGAIIGAGAVVTKEVPPYAIMGGVPAKVLRFRWGVDLILKHEKNLYAADRRLSRETLVAAQESGEAWEGKGRPSGQVFLSNQ